MGESRANIEPDSLDLDFQGRSFHDRTLLASTRHVG
jgi:hypothetical protein